jgi:hypothetical protein
MSGLHDKESFLVRSPSQVARAIADEARSIVMRAAEPIPAGDTVKTQMRRAWERLGRPSWWRMRAAWYGEAGCWSATAIEEFRLRASRWQNRQEAAAREEAHVLAAVLGRFLEADASAGAHVASEDLDAARSLVRRLGHGHRSGALPRGGK